MFFPACALVFSKGIKKAAVAFPHLEDKARFPWKTQDQTNLINTVFYPNKLRDSTKEPETKTKGILMFGINL